MGNKFFKSIIRLLDYLKDNVERILVLPVAFKYFRAFYRQNDISNNSR